MEKTIISKNENQSKNLFKFLIPSLFGLLLFVIPLPYGKFFKLDGLSPINIGIGFLAELIKIIAADYLINIALVVILASAILSVVSKFINIKNEFINNLLNASPHHRSSPPVSPLKSCCARIETSCGSCSWASAHTCRRSCSMR